MGHANRNLDAYEAGRLLNQLNWHLQHCLFFGSSLDDGRRTDDVLDRLAAISYSFSDAPPNEASDQILAMRRRWRDELGSEELADAINAATEEAAASYCVETSEVFRERLVNDWVTPLITTVRNTLLANMTEQERWFADLGLLVDEGERCSDPHRFMRREPLIDLTKLPPGYLSQLEHSNNDKPPRLANHRPQVGKVLPDSSWRHRLASLGAKLGVSFTTDGLESASENTTTAIVDAFDHQIRAQLLVVANDIQPDPESGESKELAPNTTDVEPDMLVAGNRSTNGGEVPPHEYYVTLLQMAAIVSRSKRTLERLKEKNKLPPPDVNGRAGAPDEWRWSIVRPILDKEYSRSLPEQYPADPFI